jgi:hypothetical protein
MYHLRAELRLANEVQFGSSTHVSYPSAVNMFNEPSPLPYSTRVFETSYASQESGLRFDSPDAESPSSCSPPPSPQPQAWPAASGTTPSSLIHAHRHGNDNTTPCPQCSERFTGTYKRGNLARHMKHTHGGEGGSSYPCTAKECSKVFKRADARLKHARKQHPELHLPPVQKRHGTEQYSRESYNTGNILKVNTLMEVHGHDESHKSLAEETHATQSHPAFGSGVPNPLVSNLDYNVGQWLHVERGPVGDFTTTPQHAVESSAALEDFPHAAHSVFTALRANLIPSDYSRICESFFTRWQSIVQQLSKNE